MKCLATQDYILFAQLLQKDHEYCASLQTRITTIIRVQMLMYTYKRCAQLRVKCHSHELLIDWIMNF